MPPRDYETAPLADQLGLGSIIAGLVADLDQLRAGQITVSDAVARSMLAKQIFNGVRIYLNGTKLLSGRALPATPSSSSPAPLTTSPSGSGSQRGGRGAEPPCSSGSTGDETTK